VNDSIVDTPEDEAHHPPVVIPPLELFIQFQARSTQGQTAQTTLVTIPCRLKWLTNIRLFVMG